MKKDISIPFYIRHDVSSKDLAYQLVQSLSFDQVIQFIKDLDLACEDWGVTNKLFKHFTKEMKKMDEEEKGFHNTQENN